MLACIPSGIPSRHHLSCRDCLEDKRENFQSCSYVVLCMTVVHNDMHTREHFLKLSVGFRFKFSFCVFV